MTPYVGRCAAGARPRGAAICDTPPQQRTAPPYPAPAPLPPLQVSSEAASLAAQEVLSAAKGVMASQPEGLLQRLVAHVQKLLDARELEVGEAAARGAEAAACGWEGWGSLLHAQKLLDAPWLEVGGSCCMGRLPKRKAGPEGAARSHHPPPCPQTGRPALPHPQGVVPALNRLYVSHSELSNLFRSLASLLALPQDAGPGAAVAAIRQLLAAAGRWAMRGGEWGEEESRGAALHGKRWRALLTCVVVARAQAGRRLTRAPAAALER